MNSQEQSQARATPPRNRRRWRRRRARVSRLRRWSVVGLLVLLAALTATYRYMTRPHRLRPLVEGYLQQFFDTKVEIGQVDFSIGEGFQITGVEVADPDVDGALLLDIEGMWLRHDPLALMLGRIEVDEIVAMRPVCQARFDPEVGRFNFQRVLRLPRAEGRKRMRDLPALRIQDAHLLMYADDDPGARQVENVAFSITGGAAADGRRAYDVAWVAQTDRRSEGHFELDLEQRRIVDHEGGAPWLSLEAALIAVEAMEPRAKRWIDLLGVTGRFRIMDYSIGLFGARAADNRLAFEFDAARLSVPIDPAEEVLPAEERFLRLESVAGRVAVDAEGATADLSGTLEGSPCRMRGRLRGDVNRSLRFGDLGFELEVDASGLRIPRLDDRAAPREERFIARWQGLRRFYRNFDPGGVVDISASLRKMPGADAVVELRHARITARGGEMTFQGFPYRVTEITGEFTLSPEFVCFSGLHGRHDMGEISAQGWMGGLKLSSPCVLSVVGKGIPLDDDLCAALTARHRRTWDRFSPRGVADIDVVMVRGAGTGGPAPWSFDIDAQLQGVDAEFDGFPYPLADLVGEVRVRGDVFEVIGVTGRCGAGTLTADGFVQTSREGVEDIDLRLLADAVPLDGTLVAALPVDGRAQLEPLDASGTACIQVQLVEDDGQVNYAISADLADARVQPQVFPVEVDAIRGSVQVEQEAVALEQVRGQACGGWLEVNGQVSRQAGGMRDLSIRGEQILLTDALRAALPESVRAQLAPWEIEGPFDVVGQVGTQSGHRVQLALDGATVRHALFPLAWRIGAGAVVIEQERVWLRDVRATCDGAELVFSGSVDGDGGAIDYTLKGAKLDGALGEALPWRWRRRWNDLAPRGTVDLLNGRLSWTHAEGQSEPVWDFTGELVLHDVGLSAGANIDSMNGQIGLAGQAPAGLAQVFLKGDLHLDRLRVAGFELESLHGRMLRDGVGRRLRFDELSARLYGGELAGEVNIEESAGETTYNLAATVQRAAVEGFVQARGQNAAAAGASELSGYVDGRFFLTGTAGDVASRRGGGRIQVRDAELYRLPLLLSILQVINLSPPEASAFQSASARLTIVGDTLRFRNVELAGGALALLGDGTMALSSGAIDLRLVTVSPHRWAQVPVVSEMVEGLSRELIEVEVSGTLREPKVVAQPLRNMEVMLEAILTAGKASEE